MAANTEVPNDWCKEMLKSKLIPPNTPSVWYDLGIQLSFTTGDLDVINGDFKKKPVMESCTKMLEDWQRKWDAKDFEEAKSQLIEAIDKARLVVLAAGYKDVKSTELMKEMYLWNTVAGEIVLHWKDIGQELNIKNLQIYEDYDSLVEEKYKYMLEKWLGKTQDKPEVVLSTLCAALNQIDLNYDAGWLRDAANEHLKCKID